MNKLLKNLRIENHLTQKEAAKMLNVSLRTYRTYETDKSKINTFKYKYLFDSLSELTKIDEEHGILKLEDIKTKVKNVLDKYNNINFCILFGSYAKGTAYDYSDIDLIIDTPITGIKFFNLIENLREALHKKIDLLKINQLLDNEKLLRDVLKDGIKIYG